MNTGLIAICLIATAGTLVWLLCRIDDTQKNKAMQFMEGRPKRTGNEFGNTFYPNHAKIATEVLSVLAKHLPLDLSQIEPNDKLVDDLRMDDLDSMSTVEFVIALEKRFNIRIEDADAEKMRTFNDVCSYVIAKLKEDVI